MLANKDDPKYDEYIAKCRAVADEYLGRIEQIQNKYPKWTGQDHPSDVETNPIRREMYRRFDELKEEYAFLFNRKSDP